MELIQSRENKKEFMFHLGGGGVPSEVLELPAAVPGGGGADNQPHLAGCARSPREWLSGSSQQSGPWQDRTKQHLQHKAGRLCKHLGKKAETRAQDPSLALVSCLGFRFFSSKVKG